MNINKLMPVIFVGHGSPMNALANNSFTQMLNQWGKELETYQPKAILVISAHWLTKNTTELQASQKPNLIYDFYGFPQALFDVKYPAHGMPIIAKDISLKIKTNPSIATEDWGIDHGSWTVLKHMFPNANIPVFQLSIDFNKDPLFHYNLGKELAYLRQEGILIIGSGNVIHNLSILDRNAPFNEVSKPWVSELDNSIKNALINNDIYRLIDYQKLPYASLGIKNPDHYYPLLYTLGAAQPFDSITQVYEGFELGTLAMRCVQWN